MNFQFKIEVTKDLILSRVTQEQIMSYYLKVPINKKLFRSPLRKDKQPTCSFYRNSKNELIFKDFATNQHLNCWAVVQTIFNCDYWKALKIIANDFNIVKDKTIPKNKGKIIDKDIRINEKEFTKIQVEVKEFTELELKWWSKYGITPEILKKFRVYSCGTVFINNQIVAKSQQHSPIFGYYGNKYHGEELWKIYFPKRTSFRFLNNWPTKKMQGYDQLPKTGKVLVITKAMKDVMTLYSLGIPAIAPCSETQFLSESDLEELKSRFKIIIVFFDNDRTGRMFMGKHRKEHPELFYTMLPINTGCKDISDYYKINGRSKTLNLIKQYSEYVLQEYRRKVSK